MWKTWSLCPGSPWSLSGTVSELSWRATAAIKKARAVHLCTLPRTLIKLCPRLLNSCWRANIQAPALRIKADLMYWFPISPTPQPVPRIPICLLQAWFWAEWGRDTNTTSHQQGTNHLPTEYARTNHLPPQTPLVGWFLCCDSFCGQIYLQQKPTTLFQFRFALKLVQQPWFKRTHFARLLRAFRAVTRPGWNEA